MTCIDIGRSLVAILSKTIASWGVRKEQVPNELSCALLVAASATVRDVVRAELWLQRLEPLAPGLRGHGRVTKSLVDLGAP